MKPSPGPKSSGLRWLMAGLAIFYLLVELAWDFDQLDEGPYAILMGIVVALLLLAWLLGRR